MRRQGRAWQSHMQGSCWGRDAPVQCRFNRGFGRGAIWMEFFFAARVERSRVHTLYGSLPPRMGETYRHILCAFARAVGRLPQLGEWPSHLQQGFQAGEYFGPALGDALNHL